MEKASFELENTETKQENDKKSTNTKAGIKFLHSSLEKQPRPEYSIWNKITKYSIFIAIAGAIIFGTLFTFTQLDAINTKFLSDTKLGVTNSIENELSTSETRIFTISDSYRAYYLGSIEVEQNEFEEFSELVIGENPLISSVYVISNNEVIRAFPNTQFIENTPAQITSNHQTPKPLYYIFPIDDSKQMNLLMEINSAYLIDVQSIFPSDYKLQLYQNDGVIFSDQRVADKTSLPVQFPNSEPNSIEVITETNLIPYGMTEGAVFKAVAWASSFEDSEDAYQMVILLGGVFTAMIVLFLLVRSYKLRIQLEEKTDSLLTTERLASIGQLSARVAHDINNPLSIIKNSVELIKQRSKNSAGPEFDRIDRAVDRISHQVNNVLDFVKGRKLQLQPTSLLDTIRSSISSLKRPVGIEIIPPNKDVKLLSDPALLDIVFDNLLLNAVQAIGDKGKIRIDWIKRDDHIKILVQDTGPGIPKSILSKIFEPLFTTKQVGTGLGLTSCKSIMEQHGGTIDVKLNPTTLVLNFPKTMVLDV